MTSLTDEDRALIRPIIGIENRTPQEVFEIMCDRFRLDAEKRDRDAEGCAEREVGRYVYRLIGDLMNAAPGTSEALALEVLSYIVGVVEEYGADEHDVTDVASVAALLSAARSQGPGEGWNEIKRKSLPIGREVIVGKWFVRPDGKVIWDQEIYTAYDAGWRAEWGDDKPTHWTDAPAPPASQIKEG